jgi:ATP-binding cassette subfamily C protein
MQGSILDNIRGSGKYSVEQVEQAVAIADLTTDIQQLPMGLNTMIPHGGGSFSGGQLQRILIARAVVGNPKILIMDEATSALDAISQEKISRALDKLPCTRIVIAHRLSTLNGADRILEMKDGKLTDANIHV